MGNTTSSVSGFFFGARDFTISDSTLYEIHGDQIIHCLLPNPIVDDISALPRLKNPSPLFTGRESYLKKMKEHFDPTAPGAPSRKSLLLHGMGGIGKTQICLKFIEECKDWFPHIFWIDASSKSSITLALKQIAKVQALPNSSAEGALEWMSSQLSNWLLIFDNADGGYEVVEGFLPSGKMGNILITSRNKALSRLTSKHILVDQMEEDEAISLLQKSGDLDYYSRDVAAQMVSMLGYVPVAIDQAGAYIRECEMDLEDYLELYATHRHKLMSDPFNAASDYGHCAYSTWDLSIKHIESRAASDQAAQSALLLHSIFGFLDCDNISQDIFKRAAKTYKKLDVENAVDQFLLPSIPDPNLFFLNEKGSWDLSLFQDGMKVLLSFSLIKKNDKMYSVHPLVHAWSRDRLSESDQSSYWKQTRTLLTLSLVHPLLDQADDEFCRTLLPHIKKIVQSIPSEYCGLEHIVYASTFHRYGEWDDEIKLHQQVAQELLEVNSSGALLSMILLGNAFVRNGMVKEGEQVLQQLQGMSDKFENCYQLRPLIMSCLASTYWLQGRSNEAEALVKEVLYEKRDNYPTAMLANDVHLLVLIYVSQGKLQAAEELSQSILKNPEIKDNSQKLAFTATLAVVYTAQGKWDQAEKLEQKVLEQTKARFGANHPDTLTTLNNLALTYWRQGRFDESMRMQMQAIEGMKARYGETHRYTLTSMDNLAVGYNAKGMWKDAEELHKIVVRERRLQLGEDHPDTLRSMNNLAVIYFNQSRLEEAEKLWLEVVEISKAKLGQHHPDTLRNLNNLAVTYKAKGRWNEAETLELHVLEGRKVCLGEDHPDTLTTMNNLGVTYCKQGRFDEAEKLQVKLLDFKKKKYGENHIEVLSSMNNLAVTYSNQQKLVEAEMLQKKVMEQHKVIYELDHPNTILSMGNLAITYRKQGRLNEAEELQSTAVELSKAKFGETHSSTLENIEDLAITYGEQGRLDEAEKFLVQVVEQRKAKNSPDALLGRANLAIIYWKQGYLTKAQVTLNEAVHAMQDVMGETHPKTLEYGKHLNVLQEEINKM